MKKPNKSPLIIAVITAIIILLITIKFKRNMNFEKQLYQSLKKAGFPEILALMIVSQSKYETAIAGVPYMSKNYLLNNNAFGYKYVKGNQYQMQGNAAPTKDAQGNKDGGIYAKYSTLQNCIDDIIRHYKKRQSTFFPLTDLHAFANALKTQEYFGQSAKEYEAGCRKFYKTQIV